jgi:hypothetical protein
MRGGEGERRPKTARSKEGPEKREEDRVRRRREEEEIAAPYLLAADEGDWAEVAEYLMMRREPAHSVRVFICKVLRGEISRPAHGIRTSRKEKEETYIALSAIHFARRHPGARKKRIYELTTEAVNKKGLNVSYETVANYARKFRARAVMWEKALTALMMGLDELSGRERIHEDLLAGIIDQWLEPTWYKPNELEDK